MDGPCCVEITLLHVGFEDLMRLARSFVLQLQLFWTTKGFPVSFDDTPLSLPGKLLREKVCVSPPSFHNRTAQANYTQASPFQLEGWESLRFESRGAVTLASLCKSSRMASWKSLAVLPQRAQILGQGKHT